MRLTLFVYPSEARTGMQSRQSQAGKQRSLGSPRAAQLRVQQRSCVLLLASLPAADTQDLAAFKGCCRLSPPTQEGGEMCHKASGHCSAHSLPHFPPLVLWFKDKQTLKMSLQLKHYLYIMSLTSFAS